jgi:hypothetical protein
LAFRLFLSISFWLNYGPHPLFRGDFAVFCFRSKTSRAVFLGFPQRVTNAVLQKASFSRRKRPFLLGLFPAFGHWAPFNWQVFDNHGRDI